MYRLYITNCCCNNNNNNQIVVKFLNVTDGNVSIVSMNKNGYTITTTIKSYTHLEETLSTLSGYNTYYIDKC